jgi:hypothetical protein
MQDLATSMGNSLDRDGNGGMRAPLPFQGGSQAAPGITWSSEQSTGFYRAGTGDMRVSVLGADLFRWNNGVVQIWKNNAWDEVLTADGSGTVPDGSADNDVPLWDNTAGSWTTGPMTAVNVTFDPSGLSVITETDVQGVLEGVDTHMANTSLHWSDVPNDGVTYNRRNGAWVESIAGVSDHSALNGLAVGDDHPQYHNDARGDARYYQQGATVVNSTKWDNNSIVITSTDPGSYAANTLYFITEP